MEEQKYCLQGGSPWSGVVASLIKAHELFYLHLHGRLCRLLPVQDYAAVGQKYLLHLLSVYRVKCIGEVYK